MLGLLSPTSGGFARCGSPGEVPSGFAADDAAFACPVSTGLMPVPVLTPAFVGVEDAVAVAGRVDAVASTVGGLTEATDAGADGQR